MDKIHELLISDIFILPTNYIYEGQPVSIIEAIAFKNIAISTKYRSIPDMIDENIEGFFVDYGNPQQIFNKIKWIQDNKELEKKCKIVHIKDIWNSLPLKFILKNLGT